MKNLMSFIFVLAGVVIGAALFQLLTCNTPAIKNSVNKNQVESLVKKTDQAEQKIQSRIDSFTNASAVLNKEISVLDKLLEKAKTRNRELTAVVNQLAEKKTSDIDSLSFSTGCDSLKTSVLQLTAHSVEKDSLYDLVLEKQDQQILKKDSTIQLHQQQYSLLRNSFNESITQQQILIDQNKLFQKKLKRQRVKSKLLSGLTIIAAGITIRHLLK